MLRYIDSLLDKITMYRLLLYYLIALLIAAVGLSITGKIHYNPAAITFSATALVIICWISNAVFAKVFEAPSNEESAYLTALILALIITPVTTSDGVLFLMAAGGLAMASKYILAIGKQHIFNPAAVAVVLTAWGAGQSASWWVGTAPLLPFVLVGGLLLLRKINRLQMALWFLLSAFVATIVYTTLGHGSISEMLQRTALNSAVCFLALVMLPEPVSSPTTVAKQRWYAVFTGLLFPPQLHVLSVYSTPELVLILGNIFTYIIEPKTKLFPKLVSKANLAPNVMELVFASQKKLAFAPGQYMEWTLPHHADSRGKRRYFTLASSPTEKEIRLGVKFYSEGSSFKKALQEASAKTPIVAAQVAGDFVLPKNKNRKLAFIAGGIGVTPYRSMLKYLLDTDEKRDIAMLYAASSAQEIVYTDIFESAREELGATISYVVGDAKLPNAHFKSGRLSQKIIRQEIPDYTERLFYISGSHDMVAAVEKILHELGVKRHNIKTDFFPGLDK